MQTIGFGFLLRKPRPGTGVGQLWLSLHLRLRFQLRLWVHSASAWGRLCQRLDFLGRLCMYDSQTIQERLVIRIRLQQAQQFLPLYVQAIGLAFLLRKPRPARGGGARGVPATKADNG